MKTFKDYNIIESFLDEMTNLPSEDTGIPYFIWIGEVEGQHGPRIKVSNTKGKMNNSDCFVMSISKIPEILTLSTCKLKSAQINDIKKWIKLNYVILMKMWNVYKTGNGSLIKLQTQLKKI